MNFLKPFAVLLLVTLSLATENHHGTIPRADATAYPAYAMQNGIQVGATLLTHKETKKALATDVNQCCLVVEVALYPPKDNFVKISPDNFMLREVGKDVGIGPSGADVLAARLEVIPSAPDRDHRGGLSTSSDVGYERTSNPNQNGIPGETQSNRGGIYQRESVGVGVPIGGKNPTREGAAASGNHSAIEAELKEKALPEISAWEPVSGYLYFSVPKKSKGGYELVYTLGEDQKIVMLLKQDGGSK